MTTDADGTPHRAPALRWTGMVALASVAAAATIAAVDAFRGLDVELAVAALMSLCMP